MPCKLFKLTPLFCKPVKSGVYVPHTFRVAENPAKKLALGKEWAGVTFQKIIL